MLHHHYTQTILICQNFHFTACHYMIKTCCKSGLLISGEKIFVLMNIHEFAVLTLKERMLCQQYLHGLKKLSLEHPLSRDSIVPTRTFHSIGITTFIPPENHVSTCTKELVRNTSEDKEILVKPAIVNPGCNTEIRTFCDASTNTIIVELQMSDASTQTESTVSYSDASTMTDKMMNQL